MNVTFSSTLSIYVPEIDPMVKAILTEALPPADVGITEVCLFEVTTSIQNFNREGPYEMAKRLGFLVNNSGEDMAIAFMSFVNKIFPGTY